LPSRSTTMCGTACGVAASRFQTRWAAASP
jgi:hypothetical protein